VIDFDSAEPRILQRAEHPISRSHIASNALKVLYRLHRSGYRACLVGGSVRDLMLDRQPKDFDAATDARPAQIRRVFRNSRIIGRRFRLAHVFFNDGIVEVATFRREPSPDEQQSAPDELLITSDNTFGTPREDAFRRDFTINGLFYDISDYSVVDYVGGIEDLKQQIVRAIGDPVLRFHEDPVRMLRACEFAARLGFGIEEKTQEAILSSRQELSKAAPARLSEELIQLLRCGHAGSAFQWMLDLDLLDVYVPEVRQMLAPKDPRLGNLARILPALDVAVGQEREISDSALLAALVLPTVLQERVATEEQWGRAMRRAELEAMVRQSVEPFLTRFALSNARGTAVIYALLGFQRLCETGWTDAQRQAFTRRKSYKDALALFELMVQTTKEGQEELERWQRVAPAAARARGGEPPAAEKGGGKDSRRSRPRRRRRSRPSRDSLARRESV
jgi:poly(A) polymerase